MDFAKAGILISVILYMALVLFIGIRCSKKNKSTDDFYLGGRKLGPVVTAMSAEASDMSSWLLMGLPGLALLCGIAEAFWTGLGLAVGTYLNWLFVAKRIRRYSKRIDAITIPDYFSKRFGDTKNILALVSAIVIIVFFIPYTASGFKACGTLFGTLFGIDYHLAMIISATVIISYTVIGGFFAASTTDFLQSIVMSLALVVILVFGTVQAGGLGQVIQNAKTIPEYLDVFSTANVVTGNNSKGGFGFLSVVSTLAWGLGYFGVPHVLLRFMAIDDENKLKYSRRIGTVWVIISMSVAIFIGVVGFAMVSNGKLASIFAGASPDALSSQSETVIVAVSNLLASYGFIPALIAGLVIAGIFASTMSTADSQLLAAASSVSENIIRPFFMKKENNKLTMIIARVTVVVIAIVSVALAWNPNSSVFKVVSFAWAGFGAAFGPIILCSLFWKRTNKWGALAGMLAGGIMVFAWKYGFARLGGAWAIYELLPSFIVSLLAIIVVSLLTKAPDKAITDIYDELNPKKVKNK